MSNENIISTTNEEITSVDQLAELLIEWHRKQVNSSRELLQLSEGTEVELEIPEEIFMDENTGEPLVLSGDSLRAFKLGVLLCLSQFKHLPLVDTTEESPSPIMNTSSTLH